jgi:hypothetical protein
MKLHKRYKIPTILINRNRESKHRQTNKLTTQDIKSQQEQTSKLVAQDIKSQARANQNHTRTWHPPKSRNHELCQAKGTDHQRVDEGAESSELCSD